VFENTVLRKISGSVIEEVTGLNVSLTVHHELTILKIPT